MRLIRRSEESHQMTDTVRECQRELYFFYERNTGVAHFHVEAAPDGQLPVDQAAGLLAMHCMIRGQEPSDYVVLVRADNDHLGELNEKAAKLLQAGHAVNGRVKLTGRRSAGRGGAQPVEQRNWGCVEPFRAHREVSRIVAAGKIPCARADGIGARGVAADCNAAAPGRAQGHARGAHLLRGGAGGAEPFQRASQTRDHAIGAKTPAAPSWLIIKTGRYGNLGANKKACPHRAGFFIARKPTTLAIYFAAE